MLILGDKEIEKEAVGVRKRGKGDIGAIPLKDFIKRVQEEDTDQLK